MRSSGVDVVSEPIWHPSPQRSRASGLARYVSWVSGCAGAPELYGADGVTIDYDALWRWSVRPASGFWASVAEHLEVVAEGSWAKERDPSALRMSGAGWFPDVRLNYAEQALRDVEGSGPAVIEVSEDRPTVEISRAELRRQVAAFAAQLRGWGVGPGDRVAGFLPSRTQTVVALLGSAAVGAVWTCCAPDYGTDAVVDRLAQVGPRVLVAVDGYTFGGVASDCTATLEELTHRLPSLERLVVVSATGRHSEVRSRVEVATWEEVVATDAEPEFTRLPFDHPLWVLYSSGTSGPPKGILHSQGGVVLEHLKWLALHVDVRAGDRFFWFSSTAWVVWNAAVAALMVGATVVLYDGAPNRPQPDRLWEIAAETRATQVGIGAAYLMLCQRMGVRPGEQHDLSALRSVLSSGSVLPDAAWRWIYEAVKDDVAVDAPSGGTDVATSFVGGNPLAPVVPGEVQGRLLGASVESWDEDGRHDTDRMGELVVTEPMPSMPVAFWDDPTGRKYQDAYFGVFPGIWRHGDWITISSRGTATVHGRSDSTINRNGVRIGSADIYAAIDRVPEITDSLVIGAELEGGRYWMPLFVTLAEGVELDETLRTRIVDEIRHAGSARHVPDEILVAPAIPRTLTGKRLEVPVKRLIQGLSRDRAVSAGVVDRADVLDWYAEIGAQRRAGG